MRWENDPKDLPDNYERVYKQLVSIEKRLLQDKELGKAYSKAIVITRKDIFQKLMKVIQKKNGNYLTFQL